MHSKGLSESRESPEVCEAVWIRNGLGPYVDPRWEEWINAVRRVRELLLQFVEELGASTDLMKIWGSIPCSSGKSRTSQTVSLLPWAK